MGSYSRIVPSKYKWVILALAWAAIFIGVAPQFQVAALAFQVIPELNLSLTQFSLVFSAPMLGSVFFSILAGTLGDRYGVKNVVTVGFVFSIVGVYFRYTANSFSSFFILMFLSGLSSALLNANIAKLIGAWFPREQMGTAMGLYSTGTGAGMTIGISTATLFPTIKMAYTTAGYVMLIIAVLWVILLKNKPKGTVDNREISSIPATQYLQIVARSKNVWLVGLGLMFFMGCNMVFSGNYANALNAVRGVDPKTASLMTSLLTLGTVFGGFIGPMLSDRIGRIKPFLAPVAILGSVIMYLVWISTGVTTWILLPTLGFLMGICLPLLMAFPMLLPEIGPNYAGSAGGIIATLQLIGAFFIPSFIVAPLANNSFDRMFILASIIYFLSGVVTKFLPELGYKARNKGEKSFTL